MKKLCCYSLILLFCNAAYAECDSQAKTFYETAMAAKKANNYPQALTQLQQFVQQCPRYAGYFEQGKILVKLDRLDEALTQFDLAGNYVKDNTSNQANLQSYKAFVYLKKNKPLNASLWIEKAYDIEQQASPEWILNLRKNIDLANANEIVMAKAMYEKTLSAKGIGVIANFTFNNISFKFGSSELTEAGMKQIVQISQYLKNHKSPVLFVGHTDSIGEAVYNKQLSLQRASAVKQFIITKNARLNDLITIEGKGESELKYPGNDESDHRLNRRVEMILQ